MTSESPSYRAYLLRCWREEKATGDQEPVWRFSVEEVLHERRQRGFGDLDALVTFLRAELTGEGRDEPSDFVKRKQASARRE